MSLLSNGVHCKTVDTCQDHVACAHANDPGNVKMACGASVCTCLLVTLISGADMSSMCVSESVVPFTDDGDPGVLRRWEPTQGAAEGCEEWGTPPGARHYSCCFCHDFSATDEASVGSFNVCKQGQCLKTGSSQYIPSLLLITLLHMHTVLLQMLNALTKSMGHILSIIYCIDHYRN